MLEVTSCELAPAHTFEAQLGLMPAPPLLRGGGAAEGPVLACHMLPADLRRQADCSATHLFCQQGTQSCCQQLVPSCQAWQPPEGEGRLRPRASAAEGPAKRCRRTHSAVGWALPGVEVCRSPKLAQQFWAYRLLVTVVPPS